MMRKDTCCFTGHRRLSADQENLLVARLDTLLPRLVEQGVHYFGAGGALGFDTLAAEAVVRLRSSHPEVRLIMVLPCLDQTRGWSKADQWRYERIRQQADKVVYTGQFYTPGCMDARNRHLAGESAWCVCYLTQERGGTFYTVDLCRKQGSTVINLADPMALDSL